MTNQQQTSKRLASFDFTHMAAAAIRIRRLTGDAGAYLPLRPAALARRPGCVHLGCGLAMARGDAR